MRLPAESLSKAAVRSARFAITAALVAQGAAQAAPRGGVYSAALVTPLAAPQQEIVSGVLWKCAGAQCAAPADGSRAILACQRVAKIFGPVARFSFPAGELSQEDLSRCNGRN